MRYVGVWALSDCDITVPTLDWLVDFGLGAL
jgi:hypothetical protein